MKPTPVPKLCAYGHGQCSADHPLHACGAWTTRGCIRLLADARRAGVPAKLLKAPALRRLAVLAAPLVAILLAFAGCVSDRTIVPVGPVMSAPAGRTTRAVCIGWNSVDPRAPDYMGWSGVLPDCEMDVDAAAAALEAIGIPTVTLKTANATLANCQAALEMALDGMVAGDMLIVWVSGHGGQITDQSGDEADSKDEFLCAYDGRITDDTIYEWMTYVPDGVNVLFVCDACHSGTMNREAAPVTFSRRATRSLRGAMIMLAGCSEAGTSESTGSGGRWTLALLACGPKGTAPAVWFADAHAKVPPNIQRPVYLEFGNVTDEFRFGMLGEVGTK